MEMMDVERNGGMEGGVERWERKGCEGKRNVRCKME